MFGVHCLACVCVFSRQQECVDECVVLLMTNRSHCWTVKPPQSGDFSMVRQTDGERKTGTDRPHIFLKRPSDCVHADSESQTISLTLTALTV